MLNKITSKHLLFFLFFTSFFALLGAYIGQYVFDLKPCILCLYQRIPFFLVVLITFLTLSIKALSKWQKSAILLSISLILFNALLATYHVGVEKKIFKMTEKCAEENSNPQTIEELKAILEASKIVRCDEPEFVFLNISMAGWNVIYCLLIVVISLFARRYISSKSG